MKKFPKYTGILLITLLTVLVFTACSSTSAVGNAGDSAQTATRLRCGRPALVGLYSKERGSHWVLVYGCQDLEPDDPQLSQFLIRDPGTQGRTTLDQVRTYFPLIRVIRTYEITEELRTAVRAAAES